MIRLSVSQSIWSRIPSKVLIRSIAIPPFYDNANPSPCEARAVVDVFLLWSPVPHGRMRCVVNSLTAWRCQTSDAQDQNRSQIERKCRRVPRQPIQQHRAPRFGSIPRIATHGERIGQDVQMGIQRSLARQVAAGIEWGLRTGNPVIQAPFQINVLTVCHLDTFPRCSQLHLGQRERLLQRYTITPVRFYHPLEYLKDTNHLHQRLVAYPRT